MIDIEATAPPYNGEATVVSGVEKIATSVWGLILARFVTPALIFICLGLGTFVANGLFRQLDDLEDKFNNQAIKIAAIEAARTEAAKARDSDIADLVDAMRIMQIKLDQTAAQVNVLNGRFEALLLAVRPEPTRP